MERDSPKQDLLRELAEVTAASPPEKPVIVEVEGAQCSVVSARWASGPDKAVWSISRAYNLVSSDGRLPSRIRETYLVGPPVAFDERFASDDGEQVAIWYHSNCFGDADGWRNRTADLMSQEITAHILQARGIVQ